MKLTPSFTKVQKAAPSVFEGQQSRQSGYKERHFVEDSTFQLMGKDLNNSVLNAFNLLNTLANRDDLSRQIAALPPEKRKMYIGYWERVKQSMERFLEVEDTDPSMMGPVE